jgi:hypothetical protein
LVLRRIPERWLDPERLSELNSMFYGTEPWRYFASRLRLLVLYAGKPDVVGAAMTEGVTYGTLQFATELEEEDQADAMHRQFVIGETLALLHHVGETLVRFYLAHENTPASPWIEIASAPRAGEFKKKVAKRFDGQPPSPERRAQVATVFFGDARSPADASEEEQWSDDVENIEMWLGKFAARFLEDANVWNAVKHGLAVQPSHPRLEVASLVTEGPGVTYLERDDVGRWNLATRWTNPSTIESLMGEIFVAHSLLRTICDVGRLLVLWT